MSKQIVLQDVISAALNNQRLDSAIAQLFKEYSRSQLQEWIQQGFVKLDNKIVLKNNLAVKENQTVLIEATLADTERFEAQSIPLNIIYEDADIIVINKPVGLVVHPGAGNPDQTLVNALLHYDSALSAVPRAGIIHRIDKDTSGLLVIAKNLIAHHALIKQMQKHEINRHYQALVQGNLISGGTIDEPIGRHPAHRTKMAVLQSGRESITHYRILERFHAHTLLDIELETGRTHQIRVHLSHKQYPIVGDKTYLMRTHHSKGLSQEAQLAVHAFSHQALHAYKLSFKHPITKELLELTAPLPQDFLELLMILRRDTNIEQ